MITHQATKNQWRTIHGGAGFLTCALILAATGCGSGGGSSAQPSTQASETLADHLTLSLSEDKTSTSVGDVVTYKITLTNSTAAPITTTYADYGALGTMLDPLVGSYGLFSVKDSHGNMIAANGGFSNVPPPVPPPQNITFTLQPGQSLPFTVVYTFEHGIYTATAALQKPDLTLTPAVGPLTVTIH